MRQLEEALGGRLFDRSTRSVALTPVGAQLLPGVERLLGELDATIGGLRDSVARARGRVVLAALPSIASSLVPLAVARARRINPDILVSVRDAVAGRIAGMVAGGEVDFGLSGRPEGAAGLAFEPLRVDRMVAACPASHPLASRRRVSWAELASEPFISMSRDSSVRRLVEEATAAAGRRHDPAYEVVYLTTAVAMVAAGLGIAVLPATALSALALDGVRTLPVVGPVVKREIGILTLRGRTLSPAASFLAGMLRAR